MGKREHIPEAMVAVGEEKEECVNELPSDSHATGQLRGGTRKTQSTATGPVSVFGVLDTGKSGDLDRLYD